MAHAGRPLFKPHRLLLNLPVPSPQPPNLLQSCPLPRCPLPRPDPRAEAATAPPSVCHRHPTNPHPVGALATAETPRLEARSPFGNLFMVLLSDPTVKDTFNQGAANTEPFPHFRRSEGQRFPCSLSQIQRSHLGSAPRSICQKLQDASAENRLLKSNTLRDFSEKGCGGFLGYGTVSLGGIVPSLAHTHRQTQPHTFLGQNRGAVRGGGLLWVSGSAQRRCGISGYKR